MTNWRQSPQRHGPNGAATLAVLVVVVLADALVVELAVVLIVVLAVLEAFVLELLVDVFDVLVLLAEVLVVEVLVELGKETLASTGKDRLHWLLLGVCVVAGVLVMLVSGED